MLRRLTRVLRRFLWGMTAREFVDRAIAEQGRFDRVLIHLDRQNHVDRCRWTVRLAAVKDGRERFAVGEDIQFSVRRAAYDLGEKEAYRMLEGRWVKSKLAELRGYQAELDGHGIEVNLSLPSWAARSA
jgi:hypothetical protein